MDPTDQHGRTPTGANGNFSGDPLDDRRYIAETGGAFAHQWYPGGQRAEWHVR